MPAEEHLRYAPESSAVDLRAVIWPALAVLTLLAFAVGGLYAAYEFSLPVKTSAPPQTFPTPQVTTHENEITERRRLAAEQNQRLNTWRWANDQHTLVQVPIDRAMQLLVAKGRDAWSPLLPAQPALSSPTAGAQRAVTPENQSQNAPVPLATEPQKRPAQEKRPWQ
jgi:hypothetical protein